MSVDQLIDTCKKQLLETYPGVIAIYLFGSYSTEYHHGESDIDLAILCDREVDPVQLWEFAQHLGAKIGKHTDLIDLAGASTVFRHQIITTGKRIYTRDENLCLMIENKYQSMYLRLNDERSEIIKDLRSQNG